MTFTSGAFCLSVVALCLITGVTTSVHSEIKGGLKVLLVCVMCKTYCENTLNKFYEVLDIKPGVCFSHCFGLVTLKLEENQNSHFHYVLFYCCTLEFLLHFEMKVRPSHILIRSGSCLQAVSNHNTGNCTVRTSPAFHKRAPADDTLSSVCLRRSLKGHFLSHLPWCHLHFLEFSLQTLSQGSLWAPGSGNLQKKIKNNSCTKCCLFKMA